MLRRCQISNQKISQLTNGNPAAGTDQLPINRGGANFSLTAASVAALAGAAAPITVTNGGTGQSTAGQYGLMIARTAVPNAFTGTTSETVVATASIPANLLSANGQIMFTGALATGVLAGTYTLNVRIGGVGGTSILNLAAIGGSSFQRVFGTLAARNATNSQISWCWGKLGSTNQNLPDTASAIDFTSSTTLVLTVTLTNAADTVTFEGWNVVIYP